MEQSISNPCQWFATGGSYDDIKAFTYEGGKYLYHFSPHDSGISGFDHYMACNVIFFANDEAHAKNILERMFKFHQSCNEDYMKYKGYKHDEILDRRNSNDNYVRIILNEKDKWKVSLAPTNQFFVVGWASNDNIF